MEIISVAPDAGGTWRAMSSDGLRAYGNTAEEAVMSLLRESGQFPHLTSAALR